MEKTNALKLRQSLGKVLNQLKKNKGPILVEQNSKPAAVLISLDEYQKRFVDHDADIKRKQLVDKILKMQFSLPENTSSLDLIRQGRK